VLQQNDPNRVLLTEKQANDGESDEHYLWKAAIVEGLARKMYKSVEKDGHRPDTFREFIETSLLGGDIIKTEDDGDDDTYPDVSVDPNREPWAGAGLNEFLPGKFDGTQETIIEFETGRSEGGYNFRKFRDSIEKYDENHPICLVVPNRLLFRGARRARMILQIVEATSDDNGPPSATAAVPILEDGSCRRLQDASTVVNELYGGGDDGE
jgi:hypothetical protein